MHLHEIVVGIVKRYRSLEVFKLLAEGVRKSGHSAAVHPQRVVLLFDIACGNQTEVGFTLHTGPFFPATIWDELENAKLRYSVRQGQGPATEGELRKASDRWVGTADRKERIVKYIDLSRLQPMFTKTGYARLAKSTVKETSSTQFNDELISRMSDIMGRQYSKGKMSITDADPDRAVPVVSLAEKAFSGFHQGMGEFVVAELLRVDPPKNSLFLIDEIETSLHPRAQRRLMRDLADWARVHELQIILTTHSPYVLEEIPPEARCYILPQNGNREIIYGVSPEFAMSKMDDEHYPECDLYVEDEKAKIMLREILMVHAPEIVSRVQIVPFGAASVGQSLGQMVKYNRFKQPSLVFLDGDLPVVEGCLALPGGDSPEHVVFGGLREKKWGFLPMRTGREPGELEDACARAMTIGDHHEWVGSASKTLNLSPDMLWQAFCTEWAAQCLTPFDAKKVTDPISVALIPK